MYNKDIMSLIYSKGEVCMDKVTIDSIREEYLKQRINTLRDVLNEVCSTNSDTEDILIVSRDLDELIVQYMREIKS
jgi:hypothetical protein